MNRINGKSFDVRIGYIKIHCESFSLTIEDESAVAMTRGMPDGNLLGNLKANGELVLDSQNFMLLSAAAAVAGAWRDLPAFAIDAYAAGQNALGPEAIHIRAHDCKIRVGELLNIDPNSSDKTTHKLKFDVTGRDFVWINAVPYSSASEFSLI